MSYQVKPRSHVVPAGYLRAWTHGAEIAMRLGVSEESVTTSVRNVGVRSNFYRRERPKTGETIHDVEWSIEQLETAALPVISSLPSRWPLGAEDKARVAQFFGLQVVRGPAFKAWHEQYVQPTIDAVRSDPVATTFRGRMRVPRRSHTSSSGTCPATRIGSSRWSRPPGPSRWHWARCTGRW